MPARAAAPAVRAVGAAGLIYEVVWARQLVLVFGNTSQAVSTILTGLLRRARDRRRRRRADRRPGRSAAADVRRARADPRRDRRPHAAELPAHRRGVPRASTRRCPSAPIALALVRFAARDPRPRAGDRADGRHAADADPVPVDAAGRDRPARSSSCTRRTRSGRSSGTAIAGFVADRAVRAHRRAARRRGVLRDRRRRSRCCSTGGSRSGDAPPTAAAPTRTPAPLRSRRRRSPRPSPRRRRAARRRARRRAGPVARVRVRAHVARLPGGLEPAASAPGPAARRTCSRSSWCCSWSGSRSARSCSAFLRPARPLDHRPDRRRPAADGGVRDVGRRRPRVAAGAVQRRARRSSPTSLRDFAWSTPRSSSCRRRSSWASRSRPRRRCSATRPGPRAPPRAPCSRSTRGLARRDVRAAVLRDPADRLAGDPRRCSRS